MLKKKNCTQINSNKTTVSTCFCFVKSTYWLEMLSHFEQQKTWNDFHTMMMTTIFCFTQKMYLLHFENFWRKQKWNEIYKKFTIIIVTEEVFFLARSIHNWQLLVAPLICARRIICGAQIKSMFLPQNLLRNTENRRRIT